MTQVKTRRMNPSASKGRNVIVSAFMTGIIGFGALGAAAAPAQAHGSAPYHRIGEADCMGNTGGYVSRLIVHPPDVHGYGGRETIYWRSYLLKWDGSRWADVPGQVAPQAEINVDGSTLLSTWYQSNNSTRYGNATLFPNGPGSYAVMNVIVWGSHGGELHWEWTSRYYNDGGGYPLAQGYCHYVAANF